MIEICTLQSERPDRYAEDYEQRLVIFCTLNLGYLSDYGLLTEQEHMRLENKLYDWQPSHLLDYLNQARAMLKLFENKGE